MAAHAKISPSASNRWLACPGSVYLSSLLPPKEQFRGNMYTAEGTLAHSLCEQLVKKKINELDLFSMTGQKKKAEGFTIKITDEMVDAVLEYGRACTIIERGLKGSGKPMPVKTQVECRVKAASISPNLWGTTDYLAYQKGGKLVVVDFKYGQGHAVDAEENSQMAVYAIGAMDGSAGWAYNEVELVIVQPRASHKDGPIRSWSAPVSWFKDFRDHLKAAYLEAQKTDGTAALAAGDHCIFCPAKARCPEMFRKNQEKAQVDFSVLPAQEGQDGSSSLKGRGLKEVALLTEEEMVAALKWEPLFKDWFSSIRAKMLQELESGREVPGLKLVYGKTNRKVAEGAVEEVEKRYFPLFGDEIYTPKKLKSPAQLGKIVGKEEVKAMEEEGLIIKPEGKKTIAFSDDPRRPVEPTTAFPLWPQDDETEKQETKKNGK